jgi:hypothetical protein
MLNPATIAPTFSSSMIGGRGELFAIPVGHSVEIILGKKHKLSRFPMGRACQFNRGIMRHRP